jgi:hypothetical protein
MHDYDEVILLFGYDERDQKVFPFFHEYMDTIRKWLAVNHLDPHQLLRYMIVGLYLDFLATLHQSEEFNTKVNEWYGLDKRPLTRRKLERFNREYGKQILDTSQYLSLLGLDQTRKIQGEELANFVLTGRL